MTTSTNQLIAELGVDSTSEAGSKLIQITADRSEPDEPAERDQPAAGIVPYAKGGFERSLQQQLAELLGGGREAKRPLRQ